jgi:hypothetical protein
MRTRRWLRCSLKSVKAITVVSEDDGEMKTSGEPYNNGGRWLEVRGAAVRSRPQMNLLVMRAG